MSHETHMSQQHFRGTLSDIKPALWNCVACSIAWGQKKKKHLFRPKIALFRFSVIAYKFFIFLNICIHTHAYMYSHICVYTYEKNMSVQAEDLNTHTYTNVCLRLKDTYTMQDN